MSTNGEKPDLSIKPDEIDWRVGATYEKDGEKWGMLLGYVDSRLVMGKLDLLDEHWSSRMEPIGLGSDYGVRCSLTVNGVTREDVGTPSTTEALKGAFSDALKRAAVHFGIGRELYDLPSIGVKLKTRAGGKAGAPLTLPVWRNDRWTVDPALGWVKYDHEPVKPQRGAPSPSVHVTRDAPSRGDEPMPDPQHRVLDEDNGSMAGMSEEQFAATLEATGGEVVKLSPSNVPNVERGGRTPNISEAQVEEVKRLAAHLEWGSKKLLGFTLGALDVPDMEVPEDGRNARSAMTELLNGLSAEQAGQLIQQLHAEVEIAANTPVVTP